MGGKVVQCKKCARLFQSLSSSPYCPYCVEELEKNFDMVKNYIYDHPHANVMEISTETSVPEKDVFYFLKEGRLSISENNGMLRCENCGCSIATGRFCEACQKQLERELSASVSEAIEKVKPPSGQKGKRQGALGRMHIDIRNR